MRNPNEHEVGGFKRASKASHHVRESEEFHARQRKTVKRNDRARSERREQKRNYEF